MTMQYDHDSSEPSHAGVTRSLRIRLALYLIVLAMFAFTKEWSTVKLIALIGLADVIFVGLYKIVMNGDLDH